MCLFHVRGLKRAMSLNSPTRMQQLRGWGQIGLPGNRRPRFSEPCLWENPLSEATGSFWSHSVYPALIVPCGQAPWQVLWGWKPAGSPRSKPSGSNCRQAMRPAHLPAPLQVGNRIPHHAFPSGSADLPARSKVVLTYCVTIPPLRS